MKGLIVFGAVSYELYLVHGVILAKVNISVFGSITFVAVSAIATVVFWMINRKLIDKL